MSDSLWSHELQHSRPPCPSPTPGVYSNSCPSSWWWHPTILFSVIPFSSPSRMVITFLPRSKCLLISWLQSPFAMILDPPPQKKNKVCHCFHCFLIYLPWSDGTRCHYLSFLNVALLLGFSIFFAGFTFVLSCNALLCHCLQSLL